MACAVTTAPSRRPCRGRSPGTSQRSQCVPGPGDELLGADARRRPASAAPRPGVRPSSSGACGACAWTLGSRVAVARAGPARRRRSATGVARPARRRRRGRRRAGRARAGGARATSGSVGGYLPVLRSTTTTRPSSSSSSRSAYPCSRTAWPSGSVTSARDLRLGGQHGAGAGPAGASATNRSSAVATASRSRARDHGVRNSAGPRPRRRSGIRSSTSDRRARPWRSARRARGRPCRSPGWWSWPPRRRPRAGGTTAPGRSSSPSSALADMRQRLVVRAGPAARTRSARGAPTRSRGRRPAPPGGRARRSSASSRSRRAAAARSGSGWSGSASGAAQLGDQAGQRQRPARAARRGAPARAPSSCDEAGRLLAVVVGRLRPRSRPAAARARVRGDVEQPALLGEQRRAW